MHDGSEPSVQDDDGFVIPAQHARKARIRQVDPVSAYTITVCIDVSWSFGVQNFMQKRSKVMHAPRLYQPGAPRHDHDTAQALLMKQAQSTTTYSQASLSARCNVLS